MLRIKCPCCGVRDETEFDYGGENSTDRPADPSACSDSEWADYLYFRNNIKGRQSERWFHRFGCRHWFVIDRDTLSHEMWPDLPTGNQEET